MRSLTHSLLLANVLVFVLQIMVGDVLFELFALWPVGAGFLPWQLVTCAFLHGSGLHLATNMFGLWMFGRDVEQYLGTRRFGELYFVSVLSASATQLVFASFSDQVYPTVGASGGLFGVLAAFAVLFPRRVIMLLIPPLPLPARVFVLLYAALELVLGVTGTQAGVAHFAHLGGMVGGFWLIRRWRRRRLRDTWR
jgi:membrane associated rhomboid family serine protease